MEDLHALHRTAFAAEKAEHVVLRADEAGGPKEFSAAGLKLVTRASDGEHRLFLGRLERILFSECLLEALASHGKKVGNSGNERKANLSLPAGAAALPSRGVQTKKVAGAVPCLAVPQKLPE